MTPGMCWSPANHGVRSGGLIRTSNRGASGGEAGCFIRNAPSFGTGAGALMPFVHPTARDARHASFGGVEVRARASCREFIRARVPGNMGPVLGPIGAI